MENTVSTKALGTYRTTSIGWARVKPVRVKPARLKHVRVRHVRFGQLRSPERGGTAAWHRCRARPAALPLPPDIQNGHALGRALRLARQSPSLLNLQLTIVTSLVGGSLMAAMLNLVALAALAIVRRAPNPLKILHRSGAFHG